MNIYNLKKNLPTIYILILFAIFINRTYFIDPNYRPSNINLFLSISFLCLCFLSLHLFLIEIEKKNNFPFMSLIVLYLLFCYGFSYELLGKFLHTKKEETIFKTLIIINIAIIFLNIGYFLLYKVFQKERTGFKFLEVNKYDKLVIIAIILLLINLLDNFYFFIPSTLDQVIVPIITISISILFYSIIKFTDFKNFFYTLIILVTIFLEILSSSYVFPATLVLIYFVIYFKVNRKIPIIHILLFALFFFTLHLYKNEFRLNLLFSNLNPVDRSKIFLKFYSKVLDSDSSEYIILDEEQKKGFIKDTPTEPIRLKLNNWRLAHSFSSLVILVEKTPSSINYFKGETYKILISKLIPRVIWKEKPSDAIANYIGRKYEVLHNTDNSTSWNLPIINEAYINFGIYGVIIVSFLLGILVRVFTEIFSINNFKNAESHIGIYVCCSTFFWEPHLSLVYGGLYYPIIFLYFLMSILIYFLNRFQR